jgi:hypothetical protein
MESKKLFLLSFTTGIVVFTITAVILSLAYPEIFDFIKYFLGI